MTDWNPHDTDTLGVEWFPSKSSELVLGDNLAIAMSLEQSTAKDVAYLSLWMQGIGSLETGSLAPIPSVFAVEVYDGEDATVDPDDVTVLTARPNEDVSGTGSGTGQFRENTGTTTTIFSEIDDETETEWITNGFAGAYGSNIAYNGRMSTGGLTLTGLRILGVRVIARVARAFTDNYTAVLLGLNVDGTQYNSPAFFLPMWQVRTIEHTWYYNPATRRPWTIAEVQDFDVGDDWVLQPFSFFGAGNVTCFWAKMEVVTCPETRLAIGSFYDLDNALPNDNQDVLATWTGGGSAVALITPTGGTWTKDSSGRHLYVVRKLAGSGEIRIPMLDQVDAAPAQTTGPRAWAPILDGTYGYVREMGDQVTRVFSLAQVTTNPSTAMIVDSQPYGSLLEAFVHNSQDAEQEISGAAATTYSVVKFLVKADALDTDLLVKVKRRSDNVQLGSTFTINRDDVVADTALSGAHFEEVYDDWWLATVNLATPATLAAATQYYVEFSSSSGSSTGWAIGLLRCRHAINNAGLVTVYGIGSYTDATDRALANGSELDYYDLAVTLSTPPAAPTGLGTTDQAQALGAETVCGTDEVPFVRVAWTGSATMAQQVERSEDSGATWERVAELAANGTTSYDFDDYESRFAVATLYRVRQERSDGALSDWTTLGVAHTKARATCPTLFLVSNYDPSQNIAYDYDPDKDVDFLEADDVVFHRIYGRDGQLSAQPIEEAGTRLRYSMKVGIDDRTPIYNGAGPDGFGPLRAIARAVIPYVCLLDHYGTRMFATLRVPEGSITEAGGGPGIHRAPLEATTRVTVPFVVQQ